MKDLEIKKHKIMSDETGCELVLKLHQYNSTKASIRFELQRTEIRCVHVQDFEILSQDLSRGQVKRVICYLQDFLKR